MNLTNTMNLTNAYIEDNLVQTTRVYLAGPMRGLPGFNFDNFDIGAAHLRKLGFEVFNPAENDRNGWPDVDFSSGDESKLPPGFSRIALVADTNFIATKADAVVVLDGWQRSRGARAEITLALALDIPVYDMTLANRIFSHHLSSPLVESDETTVTDAETGGKKGSKLESFAMIPVEGLEEIARVYGKGAQKYDANNWRKGYAWSLSFSAMMRHAWKFWRGESMDEATGCHHLACAAWHCLTLMWFEKNRANKDDRTDKKNV